MATLRSGRGHSVRGPAAFVALIALLVNLAGVRIASAFPQGDLRGTRVGGNAYGAGGSVTLLGAGVSVGKVALQTLPCVVSDDPANPTVKVNDVASLAVPKALLNLGLVLRTDAIRNEGRAYATPTVADARERSTIANVSALGGLVTAKAVVAQAHTTRTGSGIDNHLDDASEAERSGTEFLELRVAGRLIEANPGPNTRIELSGVTVILNERIPTANGVVVNGIHLKVDSYLGIKGDVVIAHAETRLVKGTGQLSGNAFLSQVRLSVGVDDPLLRASSGRQNVIYLPCAGTGGVEKASVALGVKVGNIVSSATSRSTVKGHIDADDAASQSTHTVEGLNLLGGLVTASLIRTVATTTSDGSSVSSTADFEFVNLKVGSRVITQADVGARIDLPGIGFVRIGEKVCKDDQDDATPCQGRHYNAITANAIRVVVTVPDLLFTSVIVGSAHSDVRF